MITTTSATTPIMIIMSLPVMPWPFLEGRPGDTILIFHHLLDGRILLLDTWLESTPPTTNNNNNKGEEEMMEEMMAGSLLLGDG